MHPGSPPLLELLWLVDELLDEALEALEDELAPPAPALDDAADVVADAVALDTPEAPPVPSLGPHMHTDE